MIIGDLVLRTHRSSVLYAWWAAKAAAFGITIFALKLHMPSWVVVAILANVLAYRLRGVQQVEILGVRLIDLMQRILEMSHHDISRHTGRFNEADRTEVVAHLQNGHRRTI